MIDMSTSSGQAAHYAAVKARLGVVRWKAVPRSIAAPLMIAPPAKASTPEIHERDWLILPGSTVLDAKSPLKWKSIVREVAAKHDVPFAKIVGPGRERGTLSPARHEAWYRLRQETTMSFPEIGRRFGNRDHATVFYGVDKHRKRLEAANV